MNNRIGLAIAVLLSAIGVGQAFAQVDMVTASQLREIGYAKYWDLKLPVDRDGRPTSAYVVDDTLYVVTVDGYVHAIQAAAGLPRWSQPFADAVYTIYEPYHFQDENHRDLAIVTSEMQATIVDRYNGDIVKLVNLENSIASQAIADWRRVYVGSVDGHFYAYRWNDPRSQDLVLEWRVATAGPATARPTLVDDGNELVFASQNGMVYCCTASKKIYNWSFNTQGTIFGNQFVEGRAVYVSSTDRSIYRLDVLSGAPRWRVRVPEPLREGPIVSGGICYQYCEGEGVIAIDAETGRVLWRSETSRQLVTRDLDRVLLRTAGDKLVRLEADTGKIEASLELPKGVMAIQNIEDDSLYLLSNFGQLICAKPSNTPALTPDDIAEARRSLHQAPEPVRKVEALPDPEDLPAREPAVDLDDPLKSRGPFSGTN